MTLSVKMLELLWERVLQVAPQVALVVVVFLGGLIAAAILRRVVRWLVRRSGLETLAEKVGIAKLLYGVGFRAGLADLLGQLAWAGGVLLTIAAIADVMQLSAVATVTAWALQFLPRLLAAAGVLLCGVALATVLRNVVGSVGRQRDDLQRPDFVAKLAYYVVITVTVTLAADQAGLETDIVDSLIMIVVSIGLGSVGVSFALGARGVFGKLTARHYYAPLAQPGDRVKVGDHQGVVLRYSAVALVLDIGGGRELIIPCDQLLDQVVEVEPAVGSPAPRPPDEDVEGEND